MLKKAILMAIIISLTATVTGQTLFYEPQPDDMTITHEKALSQQTEESTKTEIDDKIVISYGDYESRVYETTYNGNYAIEHDLIIKKKTTDAIFIWLIESENLTYHFQPPLDEEHNNYTHCNATQCIWGIERPIDVVGSYAVYKATPYGPKKVYHIYRPLITANDGKTAWGELYITHGVMSVRVDDDWLKQADYPVIVDPTIGYTTAGASGQTIEGAVVCSNFTVPSGGPYNITNITAYLSDGGGV